MLISKLYKRKRLEAGKTSDDEDSNDEKLENLDKTDKFETPEDEYLSRDKMNLFKINIHRFLPAFCRCKGLLRHEEKLFIQAFNRFQKRICLVD